MSPHSSISDNPPKRRKRNRQPVSCVPCQVKKVKCDRQKPCNACKKRNEANECIWKVLDTPQSPKTRKIMELEQRLAQKETGSHEGSSFISQSSNFDFFQSSPSHHPSWRRADMFPEQPLFNAISDVHEQSMFTNDIPTNYTYQNHDALQPTQTMDELSQAAGTPSHCTSATSTKQRNNALNESDTEIAAIALEDMALGRNAYSSLGLNTNVPLVGNLPSPPNTSHKGTRPTSSDYQNTHQESHSSMTTILTNQDYPLLSHQEVAGLKLPSMDVNQSFLSALPPRRTAEILVNTFFQDIHFVYHIIHRPTFLDEVKELWKAQEDGNLQLVDPAWMAVYFAVICWSAATFDPYAHQIQAPDFSKADLRKLPNIWSAASYRALREINWLENPQIRVLQAQLLLMCHQSHVHAAKPQNTESKAFFVLLGTSIRLAQTLRLHDLGCDPNTMPPDDPAWPPGPSSLKREMGLRLWSFCVSFDWMFCTHMRIGQIRPEDFTSSEPTHCNDDDIGYNIMVKARPADVLTDTSFGEAKRHLAMFQIRANAIVRRNSVDYENIKQLDEILQEGVAALPKRCDNSNGLRPYHICVLESMLHNRLVRLHRPFLISGLQVETHEYSTSTCLKSALAVIHCQSQMFEARLDRFWYLFSHTLGAVIALFMYLSENFDMSESEHSTQIMQSIYVARAILERGKATESEAIARMATQGLHIIASLHVAIDKIQNAPRNTSNSQGDTNLTFRKTIGDTFRTLAEEYRSSDSFTGMRDKRQQSNDKRLVPENNRAESINNRPVSESQFPRRIISDSNDGIFRQPDYNHMMLESRHFDEWSTAAIVSATMNSVNHPPDSNSINIANTRNISFEEGSKETTDASGNGVNELNSSQSADNAIIASSQPDWPFLLRLSLDPAGLFSGLY